MSDHQPCALHQSTTNVRYVSTMSYVWYCVRCCVENARSRRC